MSRKMNRFAGVIAGIAASGLLLAGCSQGEEAASSGSENAGGNDTAASASTSGEFGEACSAVPEDGAGSFDGMAQDPVATAASNNPVLSTLVTAVKKAGLVDTLNSAENITVFAPTNDAFGKIPEEDLNAVLSDKETLTSVLTYHVVGEEVTPEDLSSGEFETLQGGTVETSGSGEEFTVNGSASVACGNVQTANATVYIIDSVLMPKQ
ncbi:fasciclin domain-containing protein [Haloechinothrix halophila]|uniref:fasciclin domain-containing protein n=1 Tax=Haloechinothrix halophila TaxID=1069073 RepID=UPI00040FBA3B|nr:fasciclin domain-containing protein [Haloechinothrix halophila]